MKYCYEYPRAALTADIIVYKKTDNQVFILLIERKHPPFASMWALPGGFMNMDETIDQTALRELEEETGITGISLEQLHTFSKVDRDPRHRTVTTVFTGLADYDLPVSAGDDAAKAQWFSMDSLPPLAFDHDAVIELFRKRILK